MFFIYLFLWWPTAPGRREVLQSLANQTQSAATTQPKTAQVPGPKPKKGGGKAGWRCSCNLQSCRAGSQADRAAVTRGCTVPPDHHSGEWWAAGGAMHGDFNSPWALDVPQHPGSCPWGIFVGYSIYVEYIYIYTYIYIYILYTQYYIYIYIPLNGWFIIPAGS